VEDHPVTVVDVQVDAAHTGAGDAERRTETDAETATEAGGVNAVLPAGVTGVLQHLDPATLLLDTNVRTKVKLDPSFVGSIKDLGVLVPVVARRTADGPRLLLGQRRVLAAVKARRATVPVYLIDAPDEEKAAETARIIEQLAENDHRTGLSAADHVAAYQQLALLGVPAAQIARRTRTSAEVVTTSLQVADSELAIGAMRRFDLTLEQAAVLTEFDGEDAAVKALTVAAVKTPDQFDHIAQQLRAARAEQTARAEVTEQLNRAGVTIIDEPPYGDRKIRKLDRLKATADSPVDKALTPKAHATCPGHAAYLEDRGRFVGPTQIAAVYVCTDPARHGHADRYSSPLPTGDAAGGPMTDEQKADRRAVIANNKAWDSATTVRRRWLTTFLTRKTPPKDAPQWIAAALAGHGNEIHNGMQGRHPLALDLLGMTAADQWRPYSGQTHPVAGAATKASPGRATMLTLGLLLGGLEQLMNRDTWRRPGHTARAYLTALNAWGYPLSEVEQLVTAQDPTAAKEAGGTEADGTEAGDEDQDGEHAEEPGDPGQGSADDTERPVDSDEGDPAGDVAA
jgi:ParB family transcriptional regulator, chromosome partitioning protein